MAKDKTKKSTSGDDDFAQPSKAPAGGDGFQLTSDDNRSKLMLITPLRVDRVEDKYSKEPGATKEIIVADVVVLNEKKPEKSEEHEEVWVYAGYLRGALKGYIGERRVLGRLQNTEDTSGKKEKGNHYWELEDSTPADVKVARAYLEALNDPFAKKGGDDDDKPAKGKKSKAAPEPEKKTKKKK